MNRKLILVLSLAVAGLLALGATGAAAECPIDDPDCGDPGPVITHPVVHLFVNPEPGDSTITDTVTPGEINCGVNGDDCSENYTSTKTCDADLECTFSGPTEVLTASGYPTTGYTAQFFNCDTTVSGNTCTNDTFCGNDTCSLEMSQNWRVRVVWADTTAPTSPTVDGAGAVGPTVHHFSASGATDNSGTVSKYHYYLDHIDTGVISDPGVGYDVDVNTLADGSSHILTAAARDGSGNEGPVSAETTFTVDRSTDVAIMSPAAGVHSQTPPQIAFTSPESGQAACKTVKGGNVVATTPACSSPYTPDIAGNGDGDYTARVEFTDGVGNQDMDERSFRIDTGDPNVAITSPTLDQHVKSPVTPAFTASDGGTTDPANLTKACKIDSGAFGACVARTVADGAHTLSVRVTDEAGNDREVSVGFIADSTGPQITLNSGPADDSIITTASATYGWTTSDATPPLSQTCKLDTGAAAACSSPKTVSGLSEGSHTFTLKVTDGLGNATEVKREVFVNAVRPSVAITSGPAEGAVLKSKSATFGFRPAGGGAVSCSLDSETAYRPCSGPDSDTLSNLSDGAHTFRVRVRDQSDDTAVASRAFAVDTSVPPPPGIKEILKSILNPSLSSGFDRFRTYTIYKRLVLKHVPAGSTITVKCKGKKCPVKSFRKKASGNVKLSKFAKKKLRAGTKLTIRVTKPGTIGKQFVITIRKGKSPKLTISQIA